MSRNAIDALRAILEEAKGALKTGELADLDESVNDVAGLVDRIQHDAIGATPERIGAMADELERALAGARAARASLDEETRSRLGELLVRSFRQQAGSSPALAAALRRARRAALAALLAPGGAADLAELRRLRSELESRSVAAAPARAAGPESLPAWIGTVETLLEQIEASGLECDPVWRETLGAARSTGSAAPARALAAASESLAALASRIEVELLRHQAGLRTSEEIVRTRAIDLLIDGEVRPEERGLLEDLLGLEGARPDGAGTERAPLSAGLERLRLVLDSRRGQAGDRLREALARAGQCGIPEQDLVPAADPAIERLRGEARWLAGASRAEALVAAREMERLEGRVAAAIAGAWRSWLALEQGPDRDQVLGALADLKIRLAGEGTASVIAALEALERHVKRDAGSRAEGERPPVATPTREEIADLESAHPSGARVSIDLAARAGRSGSDEVVDLLEQAILEARTLRQVRQVVRG